jgi:hypothetical protein
MKNNEVQYVQQKKRKASQKKDSSKPDWWFISKRLEDGYGNSRQESKNFSWVYWLRSDIYYCNSPLSFSTSFLIFANDR